MTTEPDKDVQDALEKPFDEYIEWCRAFVLRKAERCGVTRILLSYPYAWTALETSWAHRYWMHHASRINPTRSTP